jgi:hypothetical protein
MCESVWILEWEGSDDWRVGIFATKEGVVLAAEKYMVNDVGGVWEKIEKEDSVIWTSKRTSDRYLALLEEVTP